MNQHTIKELYNRIEILIPEIKKMLDNKNFNSIRKKI